MFFISVSKKNVPNPHPVSGAVGIKMSPLSFGIRTDSFLSSVTESQEGFVVSESPAGDPGSGNPVLTRAVYTRSKMQLEIMNAGQSGRSVYYTSNADGDFFCSTQIALLREAGVPIAENADVIPEFFIYRYVMPPQTLYRDILRLPAGRTLTVDFSGSGVRLTSDHLRIAGRKDTRSPEEISGQVLGTLADSCSGLDASKNGVTVLLSGGLDSSILFRICRNLYGVEETFSTGYPFESEGNNMERDYALSAAKVFGTAHRYYQSSLGEYLSGFLHAVSVAEEPVQHLQSVLLHSLFRHCLPRGKSVVMSGEGADALFGFGYGSFVSHDAGLKGGIVKLFSRYPVISVLKAASRLAGRGSGLVRRLHRSTASRSPLDDPGHIAWEVDHYGHEHWVRNYFKVSFSDIIAKRCRTVLSSGARSIQDAVSLINLLGGAATTQTIWSKLGEAERKILLYPYTHAGIADSIYGVPWEIKLREPKFILRNVARLLSIPEHIITRPKCSFGIDVEKWAERGSVLEPLVPLAAKAFDEEAIRAMQTSAEYSKAMTFWNILNYAIWKRLCIHSEPLDVLEEELSESVAAQAHKPVSRDNLAALPR